MIQADECLLRPRRDLVMLEGALPIDEDLEPVDLDDLADDHLDPATAAAIVGAAVLTTTAFRLRDEQGLIAALRELTRAVAAMERPRR